MKKTAVAPSNVAIIKYWGRKDETLRLPENGSIAINLSNLLTTTTVEFDKKYTTDEVIINNTRLEQEAQKAIKHLDRVRKIAGIRDHAKVVTNNNFPTGTGLSSSSSGFAALTVAAAAAAGLTLSSKELSIIARQGSGSASRSIPDGFVEWLDGDTSETSYSVSLYPPDYWEIADVVAVVSTGRKEIETSTGHKAAISSPFFSVRKSLLANKIKETKDALQKKDFTKFGEITEAEALELHAIMLTSQPSLIYWTPGTLQIMKLCKKWRAEGLEVYFTINTGQDIHLFVQKKDVEKLVTQLKELEYVKDTIINYPTRGAHLTSDHLFA